MGRRFRRVMRISCFFKFHLSQEITGAKIYGVSNYAKNTIIVRMFWFWYTTQYIEQTSQSRESLRIFFFAICNIFRAQFSRFIYTSSDTLTQPFDESVARRRSDHRENDSLSVWSTLYWCVPISQSFGRKDNCEIYFRIWDDNRLFCLRMKDAKKKKKKKTTTKKHTRAYLRSAKNKVTHAFHFISRPLTTNIALLFSSIPLLEKPNRKKIHFLFLFPSELIWALGSIIRNILGLRVCSTVPNSWNDITGILLTRILWLCNRAPIWNRKKNVTKIADRLAFIHNICVWCVGSFYGVEWIDGPLE